MTRSLEKLAMICMGLVVTLAAFELGLRLIEPALPPPSRWPTIETDLKFHQLRKIEDAEVVFLGSSITEAAVDPVGFKVRTGVSSVFNSGIPFSTPFSNELWLDQVVLEEVDPALVVIGLSAWSGGRGRADDALAGPLQSSLRSYAESAPFALARHAGLLANWDARQANARVRGMMTDLGHQTGYYHRTAADARPVDLEQGPPEMPQEEAEAVKRMIERLEDAGASAMVLIEPGRQPGDDGTFDYDRYIASILDHVDEWGVPVVDSFHETWDPAWFADKAHFNKTGTEAFTAYISGQVSRLMGHRLAMAG